MTNIRPCLALGPGSGAGGRGLGPGDDLLLVYHHRVVVPHQGEGRAHRLFRHHTSVLFSPTSDLILHQQLDICGLPPTPGGHWPHCGDRMTVMSGNDGPAPV